MLQLRDISYAAGGKEILKHIDLVSMSVLSLSPVLTAAVNQRWRS